MKKFNTEIPAKLLHNVKKPARYIGGEFASIDKRSGKVDVTFALAFPDVYEVGMSYLDLKYSIIFLINKKIYGQSVSIHLGLICKMLCVNIGYTYLD